MSDDIGLYRQVDENSAAIREINKFLKGFKEVNRVLANHNADISGKLVSVEEENKMLRKHLETMCTVSNGISIHVRNPDITSPKKLPGKINRLYEVQCEAEKYLWGLNE